MAKHSPIPDATSSFVIGRLITVFPFSRSRYCLTAWRTAVRTTDNHSQSVRSAGLHRLLHHRAELDLLRALFMAMSNADDPITKVMRKADSGSRKRGGVPAIFGLAAVHVFGLHTTNANRANMKAS